MSRVLKHDWTDVTLGWSEHELQTAVAQELRKLERSVGGFMWASDQNGANVSRSKRAAGKAKAAGMTAGEADVRLYLSAMRLVHVELKAKATVVSKDQLERHQALRDLGHDVRLVRADCPARAVRMVLAILREYGIKVPRE